MTLSSTQSTPVQVVVVSAAPQSTLPNSLKQQLSMAHLATATALQALTLIASDSHTPARQTSSALEVLLHMVANILQHVTQQQQRPTTTVVSAAEEVYVEELAVVAACCQAVASVARERGSPAVQQLPREELVVSLLQARELQSRIQVSDSFLDMCSFCCRCWCNCSTRRFWGIRGLACCLSSACLHLVLEEGFLSLVLAVLVCACVRACARACVRVCLRLEDYLRANVQICVHANSYNENTACNQKKIHMNHNIHLLHN